MDSGDLKRALRRVFDTQVLNHGDYNLVYGQPSGSGPAMVIGYRRQPLELLLWVTGRDEVARVRIHGDPGGRRALAAGRRGL